MTKRLIIEKAIDMPIKQSLSMKIKRNRIASYFKRILTDIGEKNFFYELR